MKKILSTPNACKINKYNKNASCHLELALSFEQWMENKLKIMKTKFTLTVTILALIGTFLVSCQPNTKDKTDDRLEKAELEFEKFKEDIEDLSEDDPEFVDKLEKRLIEFEEKMENMQEDMDDKGDEAAKKFNDKMDEIRSEINELSDKISSWTNETVENMEEKGEELKADFKDFMRKLKNK